MRKLVLTLTLCLSSAWGQAVYSSGLELVPLEYKLIVRLTDDALKLGLTKSSISTKAELILRKNGIPPTPLEGIGHPTLYLDVELLENSSQGKYNTFYVSKISVMFWRTVFFEPTNLSESPNVAYASVWNDGQYGVINEKTSVFETVEELIDQFSLALLKANEK